MHLNLSADEVLTTTRSVRKRLDFTRPVERSVVEECLEIALQAPSGSNRQGWSFIVVSDAAKRAAIGEIYRNNFNHYATRYAAPTPSEQSAADAAARMLSSSQYLADHMGEAPLLLIPMIEGRLENVPLTMAASTWGSILPAVWSFMLALRERGLGSAWTTLHLPHEREVAELLGIPFETYTQAGLFPIAYTIGTDFKRGRRLPVGHVLHWDSFETR
jgi:nitroreductase